MPTPDKIPSGPYDGKFPKKQSKLFKILFGGTKKHKRGDPKKDKGTGSGYQHG